MPKRWMSRACGLCVKFKSHVIQGRRDQRSEDEAVDKSIIRRSPKRNVNQTVIKARCEFDQSDL
jgi:hypothetical protein